MTNSRSPFDRSPLGGFAGLLIALVVLYMLFKIVGWFVSFLYMAAPIMLIAAAIIDHTVIVGFFKSIQRLFKRNWVMGLAATLLSLALYPFVFLYFLGMALFKKKVKEVRKREDVRRNGQWTDYEELPEDTLDLDTSYEELPPPPPPRSKEQGDYDEYFK